jgi:hypothetical protein
VPVATVDDFDGAFVSMSREGVEAFLVVASPVTFSQRARLAELANPLTVSRIVCADSARV